MIPELLAIYGRLLVVSTPLFITIFIFTWWMRGRGFGEWAALGRSLSGRFWPRRPSRRAESRVED